MSPSLNVNLAGLEAAILHGSKKSRTDAHDALLKQLRGKGAAPAWELFPLARDWFIQRDPAIYR